MAQNVRSERVPALLGAALAAIGGGTALLNARAARRAEQSRPLTGAMVEVDGVALHVAERGEGEPLVLLHGNGAMLEDWLISGVAERLAERNRVILVDRPGFGRSDRPRRIRWTPRRQAGLLRALLDRLDAPRATVVGHSWGTLVALAHALDFPDATVGLGLVSGYYRPTARLDVPAFSVSAVPVVGDVLRYTINPILGKAMAPGVYKQLFAPAKVTRAFRDQFPTDLAVRPSQIRASAEDTSAMIQGAARLGRRVGELAMPVLIAHGDGDHIVDLDQATWLYERLPEAELMIVPGAGHMVHHIAPDRIGDAIQRLVERT